MQTPSSGEAAAPGSGVNERHRARPDAPLGELSASELERCWSLSIEDIREVMRCRGDVNHRRFAVQLCALRSCGRFVEDYEAVSTVIHNHLARQLELHPVLFVTNPERLATEVEHQKRVREYLGFVSFDEAARERLGAWLEEQMAAGASLADLGERAEAQLLAWKVELPSAAVIDKLVAPLRRQIREDVYAAIAMRLPPRLRDAIDDLLRVSEEHPHTSLFRMQVQPKENKSREIALHLDRYWSLEALGIGRLESDGVTAAQVKELAELARRYDAHTLRRFDTPKRHVLAACFLAEIKMTILDQIVVMHGEHLAAAARKANDAYELRHRTLRKRYREGVTTLVQIGDTLLEDGATLQAVERLEPIVRGGSLKAAVDSCREFQRLEDTGYIDELCNYYGDLRKYWRSFVRLPFEGKPGTESVMRALDLLRRLDDGEFKKLPTDAPLDFVPAMWEDAVRRGSTIDRRVWEWSLAQRLRDLLRSGDVFLAQSRTHVDFWQFLYADAEWDDKREETLAEMALPGEGARAVQRLREQFEEVARRAQREMAENPFARIEGGRLKLHRYLKQEIPPGVPRLRRAIAAAMPLVRIERLLQRVDELSGFTRQLVPLPGYEPQGFPMHRALLAALIAQGTNLGATTMGNSAEGVTIAMLEHVLRWYLREETIEAASGTIIDCHKQLEESGLYGSGLMSGSDGQRFAVRGGNILGGYYPRYFGYYKRVVTVYTHLSDQLDVFKTQVVSCGPRESLYVIDGLERHNTVLRPKEHATDTHGFTEHVFALCYLLGYSFMPRLRDLTDQQLYKMDRESDYGELESLFRGGVANLALIEEQWDALIRLAASLRSGTTPPHIVIQRLASSGPSDRLAKDLTALGRVVKTIYLLRYITDPELRRRVHLMLTRVESRHKLSRHLFFAQQGEFLRGDYEELMNKATCLSLLCNATVLWNTVQISEVVKRMREGGAQISDEELVHILPLIHRHVIPSGTYFAELS